MLAIPLAITILRVAASSSAPWLSDSLLLCASLYQRAPNPSSSTSEAASRSTVAGAHPRAPSQTPTRRSAFIAPAPSFGCSGGYGKRGSWDHVPSLERHRLTYRPPSRGYGRLVKVDLLLWEECPSYPEALEVVESVVASHDLRDELDAILEGHSPAVSDTPPSRPHCQIAQPMSRRERGGARADGLERPVRRRDEPAACRGQAERLFVQVSGPRGRSRGRWRRSSDGSSAPQTVPS